MREATQSTDWVTTEDDKIIGVCSGFDFCSEHEWGMKKTYAAFDRNLNTELLDDFRVRTVPEGLRWVNVGERSREDWSVPYKRGKKRPVIKAEGKGIALVRVRGSNDTVMDVLERCPRLLEPVKPSDHNPGLSAAWSDGEFCILGWTPEAHAELERIYTGLLNKTATLSASAPGPFSGSGVVLCDFTDFPEEAAKIDQKIREDAAEYNRNKADWAEAIVGAHADLQDMVYACFGRFKSFDNSIAFSAPLLKADGTWTREPGKMFRDEETDEVRCWLNPSHQDVFSCGWLTAQDFKDWAVGDGKVWPLAAMLPNDSHPIWTYVHTLVPAPNKGGKTWASYPEDTDGTYLDGWNFWHYAEKETGFIVPSSYKLRWRGRAVLRPDLEAGESKGLTRVVLVSDLHQFRNFIAAWNLANPNDTVEEHLVGRGTESLKNRIAAWKNEHCG